MWTFLLLFSTAEIYVIDAGKLAYKASVTYISIERLAQAKEIRSIFELC